MLKLRVSIVIPHYNRSRALKRCLDSIFKQTFHDFEIIIVDDGSNDKEKQYLQQLINTRGNEYGKEIKLVQALHKGASAARNRGAKEASGKYLLFCDADIIMRSNFLDEMIKALEANPEAAFAYTSFKYGLKTFKLHQFDAEALKVVNYIHTTSLIRKEWFAGFDESLNRFQDWDLWLQISMRGGRGVWVPKILFKIEPHRRGISSWLPSFFYKVPWEKLGIKIKVLEAYLAAKKIIKDKHNLK